MDPASIANYRNVLTTGPLPANLSNGNQGIRFEENAAGSLAVAIGSDSAGLSSGYSGFTYNTTPLTTNTWYHVALTWDSSTNSVIGYLNGVQVFNTTNLNWPTNFTDTWFGVGFSSASSADRYWNGQIAGVSFWNTELTQAQVQDSMNHPLTGTETGLTGYWPLDDGTGSVAADLSPYHHNGTLEGSPTWMTVPPQATVSLQGGSLSGTGTIDGDVLNSGALVTPGTASSTGILTVHGTWTQTLAATIDLRVGGATAGTQFDQLNIQGAASLAGTLNVSLVNGFVPGPYQTFPVIDFTSHDNSNLTANLPSSLVSSLNATTLSLCPASSGLKLTPAGVAAGFTLSTFADAFPTMTDASGNVIGPLGLTFTTSGGVLASDQAGNVRLFPTDTDTQQASAIPAATNQGAGHTAGLARVGANIYLTDPVSGLVIQLNSDGTFDRVIAHVPHATGIIANPANGHLLVTGLVTSGTTDAIFDVNPMTGTASVLVGGLSNPDGLAASVDGSIVYVDEDGNNRILGFSTTTGSQVFNSGSISGGLGGLVVGVGSLAGNLFVSTNSGTVVEVNLTTVAQTVIATSGTYGGFVTGDPNGSLLLTQSSTVERLTPPVGAGFSADKLTTTSAVTSSVSPAVFGQAITFTAVVSAAAPGAGTPSGTVTFTDGNTVFGSATLSAGMATFTTAALSVADHSVTFSYGGDADFSASASSALVQTVNPDATTTAVNSSVSPAVFGQTVTFTAVVSAAAPGAGTPTGTVTFMDGNAVLASQTLTAGSATFATTALSVADHNITVSYGGDADFSASASSALVQTVNQDATTAVTSSVSPAVFGQAITFTAVVSAAAPGAGTPSGTVTFTDGNTTLGSATLSAGSATFTTAALSVAGHNITVSYGGDADFSASALSALVQTVNQDVTTATVTSSVSPAVFGQAVTFTAVVSAAAPGAGTPSGTVTFTDGTTVLASQTLSAGMATFTTAALSVANHNITVSYGGDADFSASASSALVQTVNQDATTATVTSSVSPAVFGQAITFTAVVSAAVPGAGTPCGTVTFTDGNTVLASQTLSAGIATFTTAALSVANHNITVSYGGDTDFSASASSALVQTVNQDATTTAVTSSVSPAVFGQAVTFTAVVSAAAPGAGTPSGTVTFTDGTTVLASQTLSAGTATFTTAALSVANHNISVSYGGDADFSASASSALVQTVKQDATTSAVTSSVSPAVFGQAITFTAVVSAAAPGAGTPTGAVTFKDGNTALGSATLSAGVATFTTATLSVANHNITVSYGGDADFSASASSALVQTVNHQYATTATVTSSVSPAVFGQAITFTAVVSAAAPGAGTPSGTVQFKDGSAVLGTAPLDRNGRATFTTAALNVGNHSITVSYGGDADFSASASLTLVQTVKQDATAAAVTSSVSSAVFGQTVTFTAVVSAAAPGAGTPTGTVTFTNGSVVLGTAVLDRNGRASISSSSLGVGNHKVTALYHGNANFSASNSGAASLTVIPPSSLSGLVFEDFNNDGRMDFGDHGIAAVPVLLSGIDNLGHAVNLTQQTAANGTYAFRNLRPGTYTITETPPAGYAPGIDSIGTAGGRLEASDEFFVQLGQGVNGLNYNYGERPAPCPPVQPWQTSGIGFWNSKNGQDLIRALNGGTGTQLGDWLAHALPTICGASAGSSDLAGKSNAAVAALFQCDFENKGEQAEAQALATALADYVANVALDRTQLAARYGFTVSGNNVGTGTCKVGANPKA